MHSRFYGEGRYEFGFNGDLSGYVVIRDSQDRNGSISIPGSALLEFVADWVRDQRAAAVDDLGVAALLGVSPNRLPEGM